METEVQRVGNIQENAKAGVGQFYGNVDEGTRVGSLRLLRADENIRTGSAHTDFTNASPKLIGSHGPFFRTSKPLYWGGVDDPGVADRIRADLREAEEHVNPYIQALRAHREELRVSSQDLRECTSDSLASRLATQRHDGLASMQVTEEPEERLNSHLEIHCSSDNYISLHCGPVPEPCLESARIAEVEIVPRSARLAEIVPRSARLPYDPKSSPRYYTSEKMTPRCYVAEKPL
jgi:hypothetical protein